MTGDISSFCHRPPLFNRQFVRPHEEPPRPSGLPASRFLASSGREVLRISHFACSHCCVFPFHILPSGPWRSQSVRRRHSSRLTTLPVHVRGLPPTPTLSGTGPNFGGRCAGGFVSGGDPRRNSTTSPRLCFEGLDPLGSKQFTITPKLHFIASQLKPDALLLKAFNQIYRRAHNSPLHLVRCTLSSSTP